MHKPTIHISYLTLKSENSFKAITVIWSSCFTGT